MEPSCRFITRGTKVNQRDQAAFRLNRSLQLNRSRDLFQDDRLHLHQKNKPNLSIFFGLQEPEGSGDRMSSVDLKKAQHNIH